MSTKFHRIRRLTLILAGTAALSGTFVPLAMAEMPVGSDNTPADADQCQNYKDDYNSLNWSALMTLMTLGSAGLQTAQQEMAEANHWKLIAEARNCDTSTWAITVNPETSVAVNRVSVAPVSVAQK